MTRSPIIGFNGSAFLPCKGVTDLSNNSFNFIAPSVINHANRNQMRFDRGHEADCRFFFLLEKRSGRWGVVFYTLLFDKDKMIPVNPTKGGFHIPEDEVAKYPS
jgi:hypothetical protein